MSKIRAWASPTLSNAIWAGGYSPNQNAEHAFIHLEWGSGVGVVGGIVGGVVGGLRMYQGWEETPEMYEERGL